MITGCLKNILFNIILTCFLFWSCTDRQRSQEDTGISRYESLADSALMQVDSLGKSHLHHAAADGDTGVVSYLLTRGLAIGQRDHDGYTALHYAVQDQDTAMVGFLLRHHADVHALTAEMNTPLHLAAFGNESRIAEILYFSGGSSDALKQNVQGFSPFTFAVRNKYYSIAELLYWPMHYIIKRNKQEYLDELLQDNPEYLSKADMKRMTPLHIAYLFDNNELIQKLTAAGADRSAKDDYGRKPEDYQYGNFSEMIEEDLLEPDVRHRIDDRVFDFLHHYDWITAGIIINGQVSYLRAFGQKNMIDRDAVYASVSKPVTGILFVQLLNRGIIKHPDDDISGYSTKYRDVMPPEYGTDSITFGQLLTHRSGISHLDKPLWKNGRLNIQFKPGSEHLYTTNGFGVLGEILEEITGKTYSDLVKEYIGGPVDAGSFWAEDHFRAPGARVHSTTRDFARFASGVINNNYISQKDLDELVLRDYQGAGLAWGCNDVDTEDVTMMHAGSNGRPRAYILLKPRKKLGVVLMGECNTPDDVWFIHLGPILMDILEGKGGY